MSDEHSRILLIEDNPDDARLVREMLAYAKGASFDVECVDRLSAGLERLGADEFDVVLLDLRQFTSEVQRFGSPARQSGTRRTCQDLRTGPRPSDRGADGHRGRQGRHRGGAQVGVAFPGNIEAEQ